MKLNTSLAALFAVSALAQADPITFDFTDPKGVNTVTFKLDAPLESISGTANGISGTVTVDPEKPDGVTGKIVVATETLTVPNPTMREHMLGEKWLNAAANPEITFEVKKVSDIEKDGNKGKADVTGIFTLNGVSKEITIEAKVTYLPGRLADRSPDKTPGDLMVIRAEFDINRSEFNIQPGQNVDKVSDDIEVSLAIAGAAPKKS